MALLRMALPDSNRGSERWRISKRMKATLVIGLVLGLTLACGGRVGPPPGSIASHGGPASEAGTNEPAQPISAGALSLRFMSYNVLMGGGLDRRFDSVFLDWQHPLFDGRNRFADIMAVIKAANPDVLAIEEAAGWDEGKPNVADQVAATLGMSYV